MLLIVVLVVMFAIRAPIAIAIGVAAMAAIVVQGDFSLMMVAQRMYAGCDSFFLLAVPLFMFTGVIMEAGGISRRIIDFANSLVGWLPRRHGRGGHCLGHVLRGHLRLGGGGCGRGGLHPDPCHEEVRLRRGTSRAAVQASGGSNRGDHSALHPHDHLRLSHRRLHWPALRRRHAARHPHRPQPDFGGHGHITAQGLCHHQAFSLAQVWRSFRRAILALGAPVIILGGILFGVFTATESAAVAVIYALVVGMFVYRRIKPKDLISLFREGAVTSAVVMFIIATASVFTWIAAMGGHPGHAGRRPLGFKQGPRWCCC